MTEKNRFKKYLETKYFGIVLGVLVFVLLFALSFGTIILVFVAIAGLMSLSASAQSSCGAWS